MARDTGKINVEMEKQQTMKETHVFFDFDSTLLSVESLDLLILSGLENVSEQEKAQRKAAIEKITNQGMNGEIPFNVSLKKRLDEATLSQQAVTEFAQTLPQYITHGMPALIKKLQAAGMKVYIVSGGFTPCLLPVAAQLDIPPQRVFGNTFVYGKQRNVTGFDAGNPLSQPGGKAKLLDSLSLKGQRVFIGDGQTDFDVFKQQKVDSFIFYGEHVRRPALNKKAPFSAQNTEQLETQLKKILHASF